MTALLFSVSLIRVVVMDDCIPALYVIYPIVCLSSCRATTRQWRKIKQKCYASMKRPVDIIQEVLLLIIVIVIHLVILVTVVH